MSSNGSAAAVPRNVARAIVIKDEDIFFLAEPDGGVPAGNQDGFGLYYHDCRFLNGYELRLAGTRPNSLAASSARGSIGQFELTNEKLTLREGKSVAPQKFGIALERVIDSEQHAIHDVFNIRNYDVEEHELPLSFQFRAAFEDVFEIRGLHPKKTGKEIRPEWQNNVLVLSYRGADGISRRLEVHPDPKPEKTWANGAEFTVKLRPEQESQIKLSFRIVETREDVHEPHRHRFNSSPVAKDIGHRSRDWLAKYAEVESDNPVLNEVMERCLLDLRVLKSSLKGRQFFSAGLPWYGALFGRDSITAALQTLAYEPRIAEETIELLAEYQGKSVDEWKDEQPGKILHELRRGELANLNEIPQTPYYGSVDSTPLFLILVGEHANWTGDLALFRRMRPHIERALEWINTYGDEAKNGYLSYEKKSEKGLGNQGWKDSGDSIMNADGSLAAPPIALVEVQGYVYRAKQLIGDLYAREGNSEQAKQLHGEAGDLRARFNRDFWRPAMNFYALCLQQGGRPAEVISSNPGQALWTGIVDETRAAAVVKQLIAPDMFTGWGIRTLSTKERRFNPIGYHLGTVWPHDNSIIVAGLRRYGFDTEAAQVFNGIVAAASHFERKRLPEVFAGYSDQQYAIPVRYPVACHPQAWAAGSVPFMVSSLLGLQADAFNGRLRVVQPVLPHGIKELRFSRVKLGRGSMDLRFSRTGSGSVQVDILNRTGDMQVEVQPKLQPKAA